MAATTKRQVFSQKQGGMALSLPVKNTETVYDGELVGIDRSIGRVSAWTDPGAVPSATTMKFLGVARVHATEGVSGNDAVVGNNTAPLVEVEVDISGVVLQNVAVGGTIAQTDVGKLVYSADGNISSLTITPPTGLNAVGVLTRFITSTVGDVALFSANDFRGYSGF